MATKTDIFSNNDNYYLELYTDVESQSTSGNYSIVYWRMRVYKTYGTGYWSSTASGNTSYVDTSEASRVDYDRFAYDFRNGSYTGSITFKSGTFRVNHNSAGAGSYSVNIGMDLNNLGTADCKSGTINLPGLAKVPNAPTVNGISSVTSNSMVYSFSNNGNGGASIIEWQIGYGTSSTSPQKYLTSGGTSTITGLSRTTTYYVWSRGRNAVGWGPWSSRSSAKTLATKPSPPSPVKTDNVTQTSFSHQFKAGDNGGSAALQYQIGYGTSSSAPTTWITSTGTSTISGLTPGATYYVWSRTRNAIGWSNNSPRTTVTLVAGALVRVGGSWRRAVPYVRVGGVWKLARPYVRSGGKWKSTS